MLAMINVAAICNIANLPFTAQFGFASLFYYIFGAIVFFIPTGLVSAELATGWPERGGVYIWVREALGEKMGFLAIWLQWVENVIWYPTALSYTAATFAYTFNPALAQNKVYIMAAILIIYWSITIINFLGMEISGWISSLCVIIGVFIPAALIILLAILWLISSHPSQISFSLINLIPKTSLDNLSVTAAVLLALGGLEMSAVHAKEVENPQRNYPKAILLSTVLILSILSLGSLSISVVIPSGNIELASGSISAFKTFLDKFGFANVLPIVALLMSIGALGMISTWTVGPSKGLLATGRHGELPPYLQKMNNKDMPISILTVQAIIVTILSCVFLFMPTISTSYRVLYYLTAQLYLIMYILMFVSAIVLRYKFPNKKREFKIPLKNFGMWVICCLGIKGSLFAIIAGFFPPSDLSGSSLTFFELFLIFGIIIFVVTPLIINKMKKPSWHTYKNE